jgi:hypothetical protein
VGIVILGASGQLGTDLMSAFADRSPVGFDHRMVDIEVPAAVSKMLVRHRPQLVINAAAFHNVELCETRPDRAFAVNALAVDGLAAQCRRGAAPDQHGLRVRRPRHDAVRGGCGAASALELCDLEIRGRAAAAAALGPGLHRAHERLVRHPRQQ